MDIVSSKINIIYKFSDQEFFRLKENWEIFLRVVGNFRIEVNGKVLYSEVEFCLVEFAVQIAEWLRQIETNEVDFEYCSMESEDPGLVWVKKKNNGWIIGSVYQQHEEINIFDMEDIRKVFSGYIEMLKQDLEEIYNIDISKLLSGEIKI